MMMVNIIHIITKSCIKYLFMNIIVCIFTNLNVDTIPAKIYYASVHEHIDTFCNIYVYGTIYIVYISV